ncbi:MAG: transporter substrate-binding domain-containing protein [Legionellales bacterium]|nr:transporter substrate-binding domain-containing protein [Legionellales bacterium]
MKRTQRIASWLILCLSCFCSSAYATIRVGTVVFDPPYVFTLNQGFEVDLIKLLCHQMNQPCTLIPMTYDDLFIALQENLIDVAVDGIDFYLPPNPLNGGYIFSYPYLLSKAQFLTLQSNKINSVADLPQGSSVGLIQERINSTLGIYYHFFTSTYGSRFKITLFHDLDTLIGALSDGQLTAAFVDVQEGNYWAQNGNKEFKLLDSPMKVGDGIGIMSLQKNKSIIDAFDQQLKHIETNQDFIKLYNTYFGILPPSPH